MAPPLIEAMYHAQLHGSAGPIRGMSFRDQMSWNYTNRPLGWEIKPLNPVNDDLYITKIEPTFKPRLNFKNVLLASQLRLLSVQCPSLA